MDAGEWQPSSRTHAKSTRRWLRSIGKLPALGSRRRNASAKHEMMRTSPPVLDVKVLLCRQCPSSHPRQRNSGATNGRRPPNGRRSRRKSVPRSLRVPRRRGRSRRRLARPGVRDPSPSPPLSFSLSLSRRSVAVSRLKSGWRIWRAGVSRGAWPGRSALAMAATATTPGRRATW